MMLAAIPGEVGDGGSVTVSNVDGAASSTMATHVGLPNFGLFHSGAGHIEAVAGELP